MADMPAPHSAHTKPKHFVERFGMREVLLIWFGFILIRILALPFVGLDPSDPDDFMRLMQVRDLIDGQAWYDVRQYRIGAPDGADMHWSRIVDVPIAALILLFGTVLPQAQAEMVALVLVPSLYLLATMVLLWKVMQRLDLPVPAILAGLLILPLFPLLPHNFSPFRIDHHTPQALCALANLLVLLHAPSRKAALAGGVIAAVWLCISLEGLVQVAMFAGIYGLRYLILRDRSLGWFLLALAIAAPVLALATRTTTDLLADYCDILRPGHMLAFGASALIALALPFAPFQKSLQGRLAGLVLLPAVSLPIVFLSLGPCATDPFAGMPPLLRTYWHGFVLEGLPFWELTPSLAGMVIWTLLLVPAGWWIARRRGLLTADFGTPWTDLLLAALLMGGFSLLLMRGSIIAQTFAVPFAAVLVWHFLPRARTIKATLPRVFATVGCLLLATPALVSAGLKPLNAEAIVDPIWKDAIQYQTPGECDLAQLNALPKGTIYATLDVGPEILVKTPHNVIASGYHRNAVRMEQVIETYSGDPEEGRERVQASNADYLLTCTARMDNAVYQTRRKDNLANLLTEDRQPEWLKPVEGFEEGPLLVYRIGR
jgi:hypothetical protein